MKKMNVVVALFAAFTIMMGIVSCKNNADEPEEKVIAVTEITLNKTELTLTAGSKETLTATVKPDNATDKTVTWTSSKTDIATVSANGEVTAVAKGSAIITATAGGISATCTVTVNPVTYPITVTGGTATPATAEAGTTVTITANTPETGKGFDTWSTSTDGVTFADAKAKETTFIMPAGSVSVTATYKNLTYSVTLNTNGGTFADGKNITSYIYGNGVTLPTKDDITKYDFDFAGWFTNEECTGEPVIQITATDTQAKTFWAKWTEKPRTAASGKIGMYEAPYRVGDIVFNDGSVTPYTEDLKLTAEQKAAAIAVIYYKGTECSNVDENGNLAVRTLGIGLKNTNEEDPRQYNFAKYESSGFAMFDKNICSSNETPPTDGTPYHTYVNYSDTLYATGDFDGSDNWNEMCKIDPEGTTEENCQEIYPAFYWINNYASMHSITGDFASGWYIPTVVELLFIYEKRENVNAMLTLAGGMKIGNENNIPYVTSSQTSTGGNGCWIVYFNEEPAAYGAWKGGYGGKIVCAIREF